MRGKKKMRTVPSVWLDELDGMARPSLIGWKTLSSDGIWLTIKTPRGSQEQVRI